MITENKILKVENAEMRLANLLMALNVKFAYSYGVFYILDSHSPENFINFCRRNDVRENEIESMGITVTTPEEI